MKKITTIIFLLVIALSHGQKRQEGVPCSKGERVPTPEKQFRADMEQNNLKIYTLGGLKPSNYNADVAFEKEFGVEYHDFGCLAPPDMGFYDAYNVLVFNHLNEQFGDKWKATIKDNAMGFYKWRNPE